jgi:hypothetical protein
MAGVGRGPMQLPDTVGRGGSLAWHGGSGGSDRLAELTVAVEALAAQNLDGLADAVRAERVLVLRRLVDRLEGQWLKELAGVDARAAAGSVRTARALFGGPLTGTAQASPRERSRPSMPVWSPTAPATSPTTAVPRPNRSWWRRLVGWIRRGYGGSLAICGWSPTPTASMTAPSSVMPAGGSGWPRPSRGWWQWMGCWSPRPARVCWLP